MFTSQELNQIEKAKYRITVIKENTGSQFPKFNLHEFILKMAKELFFNSDGSVKNLLQIVMRIRKIIKFVKDLIRMISDEIKA